MPLERFRTSLNQYLILILCFRTMSMYARVWVLNHPVVTVSTNGVHLWEPLFTWIERALPGLPEHPYILTTAAMCGRVRQFSLRLNLIQRICVKLFEDEELLELAKAFIALARLFAMAMAKEYERWARRVVEEDLEGPPNSELLGLSLHCLSKLRLIFQLAV